MDELLHELNTVMKQMGKMPSPPSARLLSVALFGEPGALDAALDEAQGNRASWATTPSQQVIVNLARSIDVLASTKKDNNDFGCVQRALVAMQRDEVLGHFPSQFRRLWGKGRATGGSMSTKEDEDERERATAIENEVDLEEFEESTLLVLLLPYLIASLYAEVNMTPAGEVASLLMRAASLHECRLYGSLFISSLVQCRVLSTAEVTTLSAALASRANPEARRAAKVERYRKQKVALAALGELSSRCQGLTSFTLSKVSVDLLDRSAGGFSTTEGYRRFVIHSLLAAAYHTFELLEGAADEGEMLQSIIAMRVAPQGEEQLRSRIAADKAAFDDLRARSAGKRPVVVDKAAVNAIANGASDSVVQSLPVSSASVVAQTAGARAAVMRPGYSVATMSPEEWAEGEMAAGNFVTGGGPESEKRDSEADDSDQETDESVRKAREWDAFTDDNPRGWGNTGGNTS